MKSYHQQIQPNRQKAPRTHYREYQIPKAYANHHHQNSGQILQNHSSQRLTPQNAHRTKRKERNALLGHPSHPTHSSYRNLTSRHPAQNPARLTQNLNSLTERRNLAYQKNGNGALHHFNKGKENCNFFG